jgi:glycosyltransferase involved in cell wall biosynthesis
VLLGVFIRVAGHKVSEPLVTIGITCFNAAGTIKRALNSALAQDWPSFEVLIVDDYSTDNSCNLLAEALSNEPRARLFRHKANFGPAAARNTILCNAHGEFVAFFDDDDESLPSRITRQVEALVTHEQRTDNKLIACYASGIRRYPNGYTLELPAIGSRGEQPPSGAAVADYLLTFRREARWYYGSGTPACSLMARRSTFTILGGFDAELRRAEDADFAIRLALLGGHFIGTKQPLFIQYSTRGADKSPKRNLEAQERLAFKYKTYLESIDRFEYAKRWPRLRYWHFNRRYGRLILELGCLLARYPRAVIKHLLYTGPRRLRHEARMRRGQDSAGTQH